MSAKVVMTPPLLCLVITAQEQAGYQSMSCAELRQMAANYKTGLTASPAAKKYGAKVPAGRPAPRMS